MNKTRKNHFILISIAFLFAFCLVQNAEAKVLTLSEISVGKNIADCEQTKKVANEVVDKLVAENFEGVRKNFNENLKQTLSAEQIKNIWMTVKNDAGEYESREKSLYQEYPNNSIIVFTRLQMKKSKLSVEVHFSEDGKISGLWLKPA